MENEEDEKIKHRQALRTTIKTEIPFEKTVVLTPDESDDIGPLIKDEKFNAPTQYRRRASTLNPLVEHNVPQTDETVVQQSDVLLNEMVGEHNVHAPAQEPKKERQKKNKKTIQEKVQEKIKNVECNVLISDCLNCKDLKTCPKTNGDFVKIDNSFPYFLLRVLSGNAVKLYLYLCARCGGDPKKKETFGKCWPSNAKIQEDVGISANHIHESLQELETLHLIRVHQDRVIEKGKRPKIKNRFIYVSYFKKLESIRYKKREL